MDAQSPLQLDMFALSASISLCASSGEPQRRTSRLSAAAGYDSSAVTLSGLATSLDQGLPILADVVRNPRFATVMGLIVEAHAQRLRGRKLVAQTGSMKQTLRRMKEWIVGNF